MDLIFRYVMLVVVVVGAAGLLEACPSACECRKEPGGMTGQMVNCTGRAVTAIPSGLPTDTAQLRLVDTGLEALPTGALSALRNLKKLHIVDNVRLADVQVNAFQGLSSLEELVLTGSPRLGVVRVGLFMGLQNLRLLDLSRNGWTSITASMFFGLDQLKTMNLSHNNIANLNEAPFSSSLHQVTDLDLSYNKLSSVSEKVFNGWSSLQTIDLQGNQFKVPPSLQLENASSLKSLDLSDNPIPYLSPFAFRKIKTLESLKINDMPSLASVSTSAFAALYNLKQLEFKNNMLTQSFTIKHLPAHNKALEYINLSNNTYKSLEGALFMERPNLTRLALENVPFHCDCKMSWIGEVLGNTTRWPWAQAWTQYNGSDPASTDTVQRPPMCASPDNLLDMDLVDLKEEDFTCEKPSFFNASTENDTFVDMNDNVTFQVVLHPGLPSSLWFHPRGWHIKGRRGENATLQEGNVTASERVDADRRVVATLSLTSVTKTDLGIYTLVASNAAGNSTYQFRLRPDENGTWPTTASITNSASCVSLAHGLGFIILLFLLTLRT